MLLPQRSKYIFAQMNSVDYFLSMTQTSMTQTWTMSQHQKALASIMGTLATHSTFRIHLAADEGHWNWNERVPMSHSSLNNHDSLRDNIPKTSWEVCKYYMISSLWRNCFWMLALCQYCAQHHADSCILGFQRLLLKCVCLKVLVFKYILLAR